MKVFSLKSDDAMVSAFLELICADEDAVAQFRANIKQAKMSLKDLRGYLLSLWDRANFKLFSLSKEDWIAAYPGQTDVSSIEWVLF